MNIEEAISNGVTEEELRRDFEQQIKEAQKKQKDTTKDREITAARNKLITAVVNYTDALGITPEKNRAEVINDLYKIFVDTEKEILKMRSLIDNFSIFDAFFKHDEKSSDVDDVIKKFIETL